jgi:hypothetical protein
LSAPSSLDPEKSIDGDSRAYPCDTLENEYSSARSIWCSWTRRASISKARAAVLEESALGRRGFAKDHRPDRNQIILAVLRSTPRPAASLALRAAALPSTVRQIADA